MENQIKTMEILIAKQTKQLVSMISLGAANHYMGNSKSLVGVAKALRKASKNENFQALISEIEKNQWVLECLQVNKFIDEVK